MQALFSCAFFLALLSLGRSVENVQEDHHPIEVSEVGADDNHHRSLAGAEVGVDSNLLRAHRYPRGTRIQQNGTEVYNTVSFIIPVR